MNRVGTGRSLLPGLLAMGQLACAVPQAEAPDVMAISAEVEAAISSLFTAMDSGDGDEVVAHYGSVDGFVYAGVTEVTADLDLWVARTREWHGLNPEVGFSFQVARIQVLAPTVAVATLRGGSSEAEFLLWTQVWVKSPGGRWLIANEHESWPSCVEPNRPHPMTSE